MKQKITYCLVILMAIVFNQNVAHAATDIPADKRPMYHINQNFNDLESTFFQVNSTTANIWQFKAASNRGSYFANAGDMTYDVGRGLVRLGGNGSGPRGGELWFPTPQTNADFDGETKFILEFDWTFIRTALHYRNAHVLFVGGSNSVGPQAVTAETWFLAGILGIYTFGDGYWYCWNLDPEGPDECYGAVFKAGTFVRKGSTAPSSMEESQELNATCKTNIKAIAGTTYHVRAELDFATQKVVSLTLSYAEPEGAEAGDVFSQTLPDMDFVAKTAAGSAVGDKTVKDLAAIAFTNSRHTDAGNYMVDFSNEVDNLEIYSLVDSEGQADLTVEYLDQNGQTVKPARTEKDLYVGVPYALVGADKERFISGDNFYHAYDEAATQAANIALGSEDGESIKLAAGGSTLKVIFRKTAKTSGEYVWTGATNKYWSEVDANFSVGGQTIPYQEGNPIVFNAANATSDTIWLKGSFSIGESNVTMDGGYIVANDKSGTNFISGTGQFIINGAVTLGIDNRLEETVVSTSNPLTIINRAAAKVIVLKADNAKIIQKSEIPMPIQYDESIVNGTLTLDVQAEAAFSARLTNMSTFNVNMSVPGRLNSASWSAPFGIQANPYPLGMTINVENTCESGMYGGEPYPNPIVGFGIWDNVAENAHIHLGDNVRLVRNYNEVAIPGSTTKIGAISGTEKSSIQMGWINQRQQNLEIGSLNIDTEFKGKIEKFYPFYNPEAKTESRTKLIKVGTGTLTFSGDIIVDHGIDVNGGELALLGEVSIGVGSVVVNNGGTLTIGSEFGKLYGYNVPGTGEPLVELEGIQTTTTVNEGGTLKTNRGSQINSLSTNINSGGVLEGGFNGLYDLLIAESVGEVPAAVWKAYVNSFNEGDYDKLYALDGGFNIRGDLDITVNSSNNGEKITLIESEAFAYGLMIGTITVNGEEIPKVNLAEGEEVPAGAKYAWLYDDDFGTYELLSQSDKTSIDVVGAGKEVKSIEYMDLSGRQVSKNATGFVIQKITYTDNTTAVKKQYVHEQR